MPIMQTRKNYFGISNWVIVKNGMDCYGPKNYFENIEVKLLFSDTENSFESFNLKKPLKKSSIFRRIYNSNYISGTITVIKRLTLCISRKAFKLCHQRIVWT